MYYVYCHEKSFQECFQSVSVQSHYFLVAQTVHIRRELVAENDDRCDQIAATVTSENVPRLESLIMKAPQMTYTEIQVIMKISLGGLTIILHHCFGVWKRCVGWVPHSLSEEQKWGIMDSCTHMCRIFDGGRSPPVWNIETGHETWV